MLEQTKTLSKKGFTLVELVVVIAIIAILAAIAIPVATSITRSAVDSKGETNVSTLDNACQAFYTGLVCGTIHNGNFTKAAGSSMNVPAKTDRFVIKQIKAKTATVADVLKYNGLGEDVLYGVVFDSAHLKYDPSGAAGSSVSKTSTLDSLNYCK